MIRFVKEREVYEQVIRDCAGHSRSGGVDLVKYAHEHVSCRFV